MLKNHHVDGVAKLFKQFLKFGIVGTSNSLIHFAVYYCLLWVGAHYILANTAGFIVSVLNAYYWNSKYVFKKSDPGTLKPMLKVFACYGFSFLLGTVTLYLMVQYLHVSQVIAPILNLIITIPLNFFLNKFWAFK